MNKKARFVSVENIRSYDTLDNGQKVTRWSVKYLIEFEYPRHDGSIAKQQLLAETYYTDKPNLQVGPINDPNVYDMQFHFKVRKGVSSNGEPYAFQDIFLSHCAQRMI